MTALVVGVCSVVQSAAAVPIEDEWVNLANLSRGPLAEPTLVAVARAGHATDTLIGKHLLACQRALAAA